MEVVVFPESRGCSGRITVGSILWGMASGVAVVLDIVLGPAEIAPASCQPLQAAWSSLLGVRSSICGAVVFYGPCRSGSCLRQRQRGTRRSRTSLDGALACALGGSGDTWRSRTPRGGRPGSPAAIAGHPSSGGTWRRRTPSQAGGRPRAIRMVRWSPESRSWQNSNGNCAERILSRVAGPRVLPQRPGWRSSDRRWRTGLRSQPL